MMMPAASSWIKSNCGPQRGMFANNMIVMLIVCLLLLAGRVFYEIFSVLYCCEEEAPEIDEP